MQEKLGDVRSWRSQMDKSTSSNCQFRATRQTRRADPPIYEGILSLSTSDKQHSVYSQRID